MADVLQTIKVEYYLNLILRHRWFLIIPVIISAIIGCYYAITLPKIYEATTSILVEAQRVPTNYVRSMVSIDINSRISTISQQILSRTNLEKIIKGFQLYTKPSQREMFMEDKVNSLRKRITVSLSRARRRGTDAFTISFRGNEPERVMKIANALATFFIDENLKVREAQAIGTSSFLEDELTGMRKKLESVEAAMREYRKRYMGELPEQMDSNLSMLDRLQAQLGEKEMSLRTAKQMFADLKNQIAQQIALQESLQNQNDLNEEGLNEPELEDSQTLTQLKDQLRQMKMRYTERHPDVVRIQNQIENLKAEIEEPAAESGVIVQGNLPSKKPRGKIILSESKLQNIQQLQLMEVSRDVNRYKAEIAKTLHQIKIYEQRVENTPKREQELLSLERDYDNIQDQYDSLLNRRLEAEIAVNMERKQKGEQFRILDPARLPQVPTEPNMPRLFVLSLAIGLGIGGGLIMLLDLFDTSFKSANEVESALKIPVLAIIPSIRDPKFLKRRRVNLVLSLFSIAVALVLIAGFALLTFHGVDETKAVVGRFISI